MSKERRMSALEETLRKKAQEKTQYCDNYCSEVFEEIFASFAKQHANLWKLVEDFEIDAALQNDEENSQYYDAAKRLRAILEGKTLQEASMWRHR
jgi:hypothetical protein